MPGLGAPLAVPSGSTPPSGGPGPAGPETYDAAAAVWTEPFDETVAFDFPVVPQLPDAAPTVVGVPASPGLGYAGPPVPDQLPRPDQPAMPDQHPAPDQLLAPDQLPAPDQHLVPEAYTAPDAYTVPDQYPAGPLAQYPAAPAQYPATAYPGTPGSGSSEHPPGAAQDPWAAPDEGKKRKVLWLVVAGAAALVVVVAVGAFFMWGRLSGDGGAQASADRQVAIEGAVKGYLEAVAEGDAASALKHLAEEPDSTRLLTDDVLAASNKTAALTDIKVKVVTSTGDAVKVKASYRLGGKDVDQTFTVTERDDDWAVVDGTATVDLSVSTKGLPLAVNGQTVPDASAVVLFPGSYTLTVEGDPGVYITLGNATFQVTSADDVKVPTISAALTDDGAAAFRQAVRASVEACVASPNLASGCSGSGLDVPESMNDGTVTTEGTVVRTLSPDLSAELDGLAPRLSGTNPSRAYAVAPNGLVNIAVTGTRDGQEVAGDVLNKDTGQPGFQLGTPEVDMTDPALPVTWSGR